MVFRNLCKKSLKPLTIISVDTTIMIMHLKNTSNLTSSTIIMRTEMQQPYPSVFSAAEWDFVLVFSSSSGPAFKPNQFFYVPPIEILEFFPLYLLPTCGLLGGQHCQLISADSPNGQISPSPTVCRSTSSSPAVSD